jgi:protein phosphatase
MSFATMTDRGKVRRRNEDAAFALAHERLTALGNLSLGLFMVADGMGGQTAGDRASAIAIQTSSEFLLREIVFPLATLLENAQPSMPIQEAIERAFLVANNQVLREVSGGGATLTAALLIGQRVYVGHVGDCRLYLLRAGSLQLLTRDHSLLNRLIELGQMEAGPDYQPERDPRRNSLWQAMGQSEDPEVDIASHRLEPGDGLLLCCDGLWSAVSAESMAGIMLGAASPAAACQQLIGAANAAGGPDNITAIIVYPLGMPERLPTDSAAQAPDERRTDP